MKNDVEEYVVVARQWQQPHDKLKKYNWREKKKRKKRNETQEVLFVVAIERSPSEFVSISTRTCECV